MVDDDFLIKTVKEVTVTHMPLFSMEVIISAFEHTAHVQPLRHMVVTAS